MTGNAHDRGIAGLRLGKLGNGVMAQIVEPQSFDRAFHIPHVSTLFRCAFGARGLRQPTRGAGQGAR